MPRAKRPRLAARRDANHNVLVRRWLSYPGTSWCDTSQLPGELDGFAGAFRDTRRIEIKDGSLPPSARQLTKDEEDIFAAWTGGPCVLWERESDVDATYREMSPHAR